MEYDELRALDRLIMEMFKARDEAMTVLAREAERTRAQQNEWRAALEDLSQHKIDKVTFDARNKAFDEKLDLANLDLSRISTEIAQNRGSDAATNRVIGLIIAVFTVGVTLAGILLTR